MCHAMEEDDWVDVVMPYLQDTPLKGGSSYTDGDRHRENLKDACDGGDGDNDQLEEQAAAGSNIGSACTDAVLSDERDGGPHICTFPSTSETVERELILCPNRCGVQLPAEDVDEHLSQSCRRAIVECEFAGCNVKLPRAEMQFHYRNEMPMHLLLLSKNVATMMTKMETLEDKLATTSPGRTTRKEHRHRAASGGRSGAVHIEADTQAANTAAQSPSGGFMSRFPFSLFTKKTSVVCSTCHEEFRCNSAESIGVVNCERYHELLCKDTGKKHVVGVGN